MFSRVAAPRGSKGFKGRFRPKKLSAREVAEVHHESRFGFRGAPLDKQTNRKAAGKVLQRRPVSNLTFRLIWPRPRTLVRLNIHSVLPLLDVWELVWPAEFNTPLLTKRRETHMVSQGENGGDAGGAGSEHGRRKKARTSVLHPLNA